MIQWAQQNPASHDFSLEDFESDTIRSVALKGIQDALAQHIVTTLWQGGPELDIWSSNGIVVQSPIQSKRGFSSLKRWKTATQLPIARMKLWQSLATRNWSKSISWLTAAKNIASLPCVYVTFLKLSSPITTPGHWGPLPEGCHSVVPRPDRWG
jgi:hypothetical protein